MNLLTSCVCSVLLGLLAIQLPASESQRTIALWPGAAPGETDAIAPEKDTTKPTDELIAGKRVIRLGNVSKPDITIYPAPKDKNTGSAVIVCPGGGYYILAMDLEGTEVCEWLNSIGVTGVLLKYRVPKRQHEEGHMGPLQDAQRAFGLVRKHAKEWGCDPKRIGVLGFSAGGHLAAALSNNNEKRSYPRIDEADDLDCRPDFALLIYPGLLIASKDSTQLAPELKVTARTPATFIVMAANDPVRSENALYYALELKKAKVPVELHIYDKGGHGYGLRHRTDLPVTTWPARAEDWLRSSGFVNSPR